MSRLTRECVITEKIDGTNASVVIAPTDPADAEITIAERDGMSMFAGSRTRWIVPGADNFAFAGWVKANSDALWSLGEGTHCGEWWGLGVQRGYGLTERRFSLFNTLRWADDRDREKYPTDRPACCHVVPVLYRGLFGPKHAEDYIAKLSHEGSMAAPGFMKPEGIVVYHVAANMAFKKTIDKDEQPKGQKS